jgi:type II secretory pathway pseudopilin PulG
MQVANGNLHARVPLDQHNVLWTIAGSLNNLVARLQRWRQDAIQLRQNEQALQQLLYNIQMARREGKSLQAYTTGTSLDALIQEVSKWRAAPQQHNQSISIKQPPDSWS